ncbi:hypothetical protein XD13_03385 [Staphylococcus aureus]|nr:hypothetical protein AB525_07270 [Staphylococcus aureus]EEV70612.1 hypothetical protein SALG_01968 [Staphylococcus aureus A9635]OHP83363.1 hypothetical protein HMPREF2658_04840 [Staphylococcus sp. HMSC062H10]KIT63091.1 hypothetical protein QP65_06645 [Staphylococcus aureus]KKJ90356.1 hypothetical protein TN60_02425 [Staphylococcus aureus]
MTILTQLSDRIKKPSQQLTKPQTNQTYSNNARKSPMYHSPIT